ncbi:PRTRC system protein D [Methylomonas sp. AM2-LC]|uniref:PRTRC system protein D n=1 Tax=Methylomonas sp. AM2-LC TaxID=3153301 RepID=UPI0032632839
MSLNSCVAAVDIGYGNVKYSYYNNGKIVLPSHFPSTAKLVNGSVNKGVLDWSDQFDILTVMAEGFKYMVGPDVTKTMSVEESRNRPLLKDYVETPQHMALLKGALRFIGKREINILITGLPVDYYNSFKDVMREKVTGIHDYPDGERIVVHEAKVMPQPMGGFVNYFLDNNELSRFKDLRSLTIDVGYCTLDWLMCESLVMNDGRSNSIRHGMSSVLERYKNLINADTGYECSDVSRIDEGLRKGCVMRINGEEYNFSKFTPIVNQFIQEGAMLLMAGVGELQDIDVILIVGGGAIYFKEQFELVLKRKIILCEDDIYSNVRGYLKAGISINKTNVATVEPQKKIAKK